MPLPLATGVITEMTLTMTRTRTQTALNKLARLAAGIQGEVSQDCALEGELPDALAIRRQPLQRDRDGLYATVRLRCGPRGYRGLRP